MTTTADLAAAGVRLDREGAVVTITLDRPQVRNAQTPAMWRALAALGEDLGREADDGVRVVVVRGEGPSFSAGLDRTLLMPGDGDVESISGLAELDADEMSARIEVYQRGFTFLADPRFVSVAAVQGHAVGAGFQLALACDLRVMADDATFCMKEAALGLVPDLAGTRPLVQAVGYSRALELCATARTVGADEAVRIGLALAAVPAADLDVTVADLVGALVAPLPGVVPEIKALLRGADARSLDEQRRHEREAQVRRLTALAAMSSARSAVGAG